MVCMLQAQGTTIPACFLHVVCQTLLFLTEFLPKDRTEIMEEALLWVCLRLKVETAATAATDV